MTGEERGMLPYAMVENYVKAKKCSRLEWFTFIDESDAIRCAIGFFFAGSLYFFEYFDLYSNLYSKIALK